jgi:hypothetical protein
MFLVKFCCASSRNPDEDPNSNIQFSIDPNSSEVVEKKLKKLKNVMIEYMHFERSMGAQNVDVIKLIELVLNKYENNEVPKKELQQTFNKIKEINLKQLKKVLTQQFFFTDSERDNYDFSKIQLFNILYAGGNEAYKVNFFFKLVQS